MCSQQRKFQNYLHLHTKAEKDPYSCNICRKSFTVPARLTRHYRTHTGEKPFQCDYCSKSFSVKENLSVHRRIHTKERPYKCDICASAFEHSGKLHRHMRIHTGERPHQCSICNKRFIQSGQLVIHMRTHTGEKPYICKFCEKGFTCSKQLKVHTRTHTGEKPYTCDICGKSFGYNHVLKLHQVAHYGEKCYKCTICYETFNSKRLMESHIKDHSDSLITDYSTKIEFHLNNTNDRNGLLSSNYIHNHEIPVNEKKLFNFTKIKNSQSAVKLKQSDISDVNLTKIISEQRYFVLNTKTHTSESLSNQNIDELSKRKLNINNVPTTEQHTIIDHCDLDNSCLYEIQNNELFTKTYLKTIRLSNISFMDSVDTRFDQYEDKRRMDSEQIKSGEVFESAYHTEFNDQINKNTLNYIIAKKKINYSLPPRKRSKMILESMNIENFKIQSPPRCHSVIKFANSKINNSINDDKACLGS